jgi:hypothetical protein
VAELSDLNGSWHPTGSSFRHVLERLIGETVRIQTNDSAFTGKLASAVTSFVTLAAGATTNVTLVYIPVRHINAVTEL